VIAFAGAAAVAAGIAVALLPAWRIAGRDVQAALRAGGHGTTDGGGQRVRAALYDRILERVQRLPGARSAAWIVPAVISQRAASTVWPGEDAVGRTFLRADPSQPKKFEVVGIVADDRATALDTPSPLMVYVPYRFNNEGKSVLVVHAGDATAAVGEVRRAVREVDPEIAIADAVPLARVIDKALEARRYQMWLFVALGLVAADHRDDWRVCDDRGDTRPADRSRRRTARRVTCGVA
jgi:hypothetical protein